MEALTPCQKSRGMEIFSFGTNLTKWKIMKEKLKSKTDPSDQYSFHFQPQYNFPFIKRLHLYEEKRLFTTRKP